jgi:predicted transcriptional regulator
MKNAIGRRKKAKNKKTNLPFNWRAKVIKMLADKGFQVEPWKVTDINRGRYIDDNLTIPVLEAIDQLKNDHTRKMKRIAQLKSA